MTRSARRRRSKQTKDSRVLFLYLLLRDTVPMGEMERILGIIEESCSQGATEFHFSDALLTRRARYFESRLKALAKRLAERIAP